MIGKLIHNYKIEKLIGEGGMGKVYLAQHNQLNRKVAIKVLHSHLVYSNEFRNRFKSEANLLANLQHPNIVTLHDYIENNDFLALIMEYVEGTSLENYIKKNKYIDEKELIFLFSQVLNAFQFAHDKGIIHRDIKPANIILTNERKIKILDFGIAKIKGSLSQTQTGTQMGTVLYMSPEQIKGQKIDLRSDIYSLGVTLFELATGKTAYDPNSSIYEVSNAIVHKTLPKPSSINPKIHSVIEKAILKATEKNPKDRFQSCNEFLQAITPQKKRSFFSSVINWILVLTLLSALSFFGWQLYQRYIIQNQDLSWLKENLNTPEDTNNSSSYNTELPYSEDNEPLQTKNHFNSQPMDTSSTVMNTSDNEKPIVVAERIINEFLQKLNNENSFTNLLAEKILVFQNKNELPQLLSQDDTQNLLINYFQLKTHTTENSYSIIGNFKTSQEDGLIKIENLIIQKEILSFPINLTIREYDKKITEIYLKD